MQSTRCVAALLGDACPAGGIDNMRISRRGHSFGLHGSASLAQRAAASQAVVANRYEATGLNPYDVREQCKIKPLCYDFTDVQTFLDNATVQAALGVQSHIDWQSCNFTVNAAFQNDWMKDM
jgi:hypothetical protein